MGWWALVCLRCSDLDGHHGADLRASFKEKMREDEGQGGAHRGPSMGRLFKSDLLQRRKNHTQSEWIPHYLACTAPSLTRVCMSIQIQNHYSLQNDLNKYNLHFCM
jgi:hypothetical protein